MLTSLQISTRYNAALLKTLVPAVGADPWGVGAGDHVDTQTILFDDNRTDEVVAALNGYDAHVLMLAKAERVDQVNRLRDDKIEGGFGFSHQGEDYPIQSRQSDRENVIGLGLAAMGAISAGAKVDDLEWLTPGQAFGFITGDNRTILLDAAGMLALYRRGLGFKMALTLHARSLKDAILGATDLGALDAINVTNGWPD